MIDKIKIEEVQSDGTKKEVKVDPSTGYHNYLIAFNSIIDLDFSICASSQLRDTTAVAFNICSEHFALISDEITLIKYFSIGTIFIAVILLPSRTSFNEWVNRCFSFLSQ